MRALKISENHGLWVAETSAGVRASGASLESAMDKLALEEGLHWDGLNKVFQGIRPVSTGQIAHGQASG